MRVSDCIVVGGGVAGAMTARVLSRRGLNVFLFDAGSIHPPASWAAGGILSPLCPWRCESGVYQLAQAGQRMYESLARELSEETGVNIEWVRSGLVSLGGEDAALAEHWSRVYQEPIEKVSAQDLVKLEPELSADCGAGIRLPSVAQLRPPRLLAALRHTYGSMRFMQDEEIANLRIVNNRVCGVQTTTGDEYGADRVVIAAGSWSAGLLRGAGLVEPRIRPVKGQMILYEASSVQLKHIVVVGSHYLIPRLDGRILVGSTVEECGFDLTATDAARTNLHDFACSVVPALAPASISHQWAGLRPAAEREAPMIGRHPDIEGLFLNVGHYRNGVVQAPAAAELLAALMMDENPDLDPVPFAVEIGGANLADASVV